MSSGTGRLEPLGVFGLPAPDRLRLDPDELRRLSDALDIVDRHLVADYLLSAPVVIPLTEYTEDVLGDLFGVAGGTAVVSDGTYYWRRDAAEYVLHYGVDVGARAVAHMRALDWRAPELDQADLDALDVRLYELLRPRGGTPRGRYKS